jgi:hypothetical protein
LRLKKAGKQTFIDILYACKKVREKETTKDENE